MNHITAAGLRAAGLRLLAWAALGAVAVAVTFSPAVRADGTYGPVQPGEGLGQVAQKLRPDPAIPLKRVMQALYHANRDAFMNGDIQQLLVGSTLQVPDLNALPRTPLATPLAELASAPPDGVAPVAKATPPFPAVAQDAEPPGGVMRPRDAKAATTPPAAAPQPVAAPPAAAVPAAVPPAPVLVPAVPAAAPPAKAAEAPGTAPAAVTAPAPTTTEPRHDETATAALREQLQTLTAQNAEIRKLVARSDAETQRMRADLQHMQQQHAQTPPPAAGGSQFGWLAALLAAVLAGAGAWWWPRRSRPQAAAPVASPPAPAAAGAGAAAAAADGATSKPLFATDPVATGLDWLSVLHTLGDADRFREEVQGLLLQPELRSRPEWRTIRALGRDLLPNDPLFSGPPDEERDSMSPREPLPSMPAEPPTTGPYPSLNSDATPALPLRLGIPASHQAALMVADRRGITGRYTALTDDEVGTKLALAHVYLDHGDFDNARAMLQEVTDGQHPSYSQEAKALMEAISRRPAMS
jgi:FimV-like protein